jgi:hypothetical protein
VVEQNGVFDGVENQENKGPSRVNAGGRLEKTADTVNHERKPRSSEKCGASGGGAERGAGKHRGLARR